MKVSISWLKELIDLKVPVEKLIKLLPLRTIGLKSTDENFFELDMKGYNRADLLSMRGVAREVSAIADSPASFKPVNFEFKTQRLCEIPVEIESKELAPVYCLVKIENLKVKPSSPEWIKKLTDSGIRSINNVADITNLAMIEFGQPMHAFDAEKVKGKIKVKTARKDEQITTLDGKIRNLNEKDLLITDEAGPIGIAGIMGEKMSEISSSTTTILLEAAIFKPIPIRKSAQRLGLHSESSKRFQHGLTKTNLLQALSSAIKMYEALGGKLTAITLKGNLADEVKTIKLTQQKVNSLIGIAISSKQIESFLTALGFKLTSRSSDGNAVWDVAVPYWRLDIEIEEDLIEEVARMYGYEKIPAKTLDTNIPDHTQNPLFGLLDALKKALVMQGLTEVETYSYYSTQVIKNLKLKVENLIRVANPISAETEYLRNNLWPNLLEVAAKNIRNNIKDIAIFEIGKVYAPRKENLPKENYHLSIALSNGTDNPIQELNQIYKAVLKHLQGEEVQLHSGVEQKEQNETKYFHPTRFKSLGKADWMAEIHPRFVNKFGVDQRVSVLEIDIEATMPQ